MTEIKLSMNKELNDTYNGKIIEDGSTIECFSSTLPNTLKHKLINQILKEVGQHKHIVIKVKRGF